MKAQTVVNQSLMSHAQKHWWDVSTQTQSLGFTLSEQWNSNGLVEVLSFLPAISDSTAPFFSTQRSTFIVLSRNQVPGIVTGFQILPFKGAFVFIVFLLWLRNSTGRNNCNKGKDHDSRSIASGCHPKSTMHTPLCFSSEIRMKLISWVQNQPSFFTSCGIPCEMIAVSYTK